MLAAYLRRLAAGGQYGHSRKPDNYYMSDSYCSFYWNSHGIVPDHETWEKVARLSKRYLSFVSYCREVYPQWQDLETIHWADNSVEKIQQSLILGINRRVLVKAAGGDACF